MLYVYVICICYMYCYMHTLYVYVIFICYIYMLYVYVICICYMYMLYVYVICICDLFSLMLLLQFETIFLAWFLPFSLINLIVVFPDGSSIFVAVIFFIVIRVTVIIYKRWKKIFVISEISQRYKGWWSFIIIIYLMSMTASIV